MYKYQVITMVLWLEFAFANYHNESILSVKYKGTGNVLCGIRDCSYHGICNGNKKQFACLCFKPYYGRRCEYEYVVMDLMNLLSYNPHHKLRNQNECSYKDCNNRGTCLGTQDAPLCLCDFGYRGWRCEISLPCDSLRHCSGHGNCIGQPDRFICFCKFGFFGLHCQHTFLKNTDARGLTYTKVS